jgi:Dolichyl-phosphate-mannose-protein mannosyltransferase
MMDDVSTIKTDPESPAARQANPSTSLWDLRLAPFLEKYCWLLLIALLVIASIRIISTYGALSLTIDEPTHLACGLEFLANHTYNRDPVDPPLSRIMQALGPWLAGARPLGIARTSVEGLSVIASSGHVNRTIFLMRLGNLPFFLLACLVVFEWSRRAFGKPTAILATALFTFLPAVLADAGLATTDMAASATIGMAFLAMLFWAERPAWSTASLLGLSTALACLSKLSGLGYLPICAYLALVIYLAVCRPSPAQLIQRARERAPTFILAAFVAALCVWIGYRFSIGDVTIHHRVFVAPAPEFFAGIRALFEHNKTGHPAFLLGRFGYSGWWYYFPVALAVKTPLPFLILIALGVFVALSHAHRVQYLLPLALVLGILLPAMHGHINIGIRHIAPMWIGLAMIAALGVRWLLQSTRMPLAVGVSALALLFWLVISVAIHHPDYLGYFNGFAGSQPEKIVVDSNYDWGQDLRLLAVRLHTLGASHVALADLDGIVDAYPARYQALQDWYGLPPAQQLDPCTPAIGWNVVSTTVAKSSSHLAGSPFYRGDSSAWYDQIPPTERVGPLLLYNITAANKLVGSHCH